MVLNFDTIILLRDGICYEQKAQAITGSDF